MTSPTVKPAASSRIGFVLTRQRPEMSGAQDLIFWVATEQGPLKVIFKAQESVCFIAASDLPKVQRILGRTSGWRSAESKLKHFNQAEVVTLYFKTQRLLFDCRERIEAEGLWLYESDVNPSDRFLMERFITGGIEVNGQIESNTKFASVANPTVRTTDFRPNLSCVSLDIETAYTGNELYSIGIYTVSEECVFMVGADATVAETENLRLFADERSLVTAFLDWLTETDPDVLIGWNIVNFDLRFLQDVCDRLRIQFTLGRNNEPIKWRQARDNRDRYFALIPGRVVLDGIELMRTATYQFENFSLNYVANQILNRGKLVDDVDQRGEEITRLFNEDKPALTAYNLEDCRLVWDIFAKEQLIEFAIERSQLTGLELNRYGGSVAAFDYLYLPRLHRAGYVAPGLGQNAARNMSPGGYVMNSEPGIYDNVIVLDFKSLYPSIIRTFHVDPLALTVGLTEDDAIEGFDGGRFSRGEYLLPKLIETLWQARDRAKESGNKVLSQAIKIIMNSFYGVLGTTGCRFFDPRLVSSITKRGHQIIKESKIFIEEAGYKVIYGDTDSVFVLIGSNPDSSVKEIGDKLAEGLNRWWTLKLQSEMQIESCLEIEFETHFDKFLMPTVRGAEMGSKKRYAGLVRTGRGEKDYRLIFKGLETVRSDWSPLARKFQQQLYEKIFLELPFEEFIKQTVASIQDGTDAQQLILRRRLRRKLDDYVKNVPPHVQAARKAETIRAEKGLPQRYANGGWIEYIMTVNGPEPIPYNSSPVDTDFYIDRQIAPIVDSILVFKSSSLKELLDNQIELF